MLLLSATVFFASLLGFAPDGQAPSANSKVSISIAPAKSAVVVGEPVVVWVTLSGFRALPLKALEDISRLMSELSVYIDRGAGFERHVTSSVGERYGELQSVTLDGRAATISVVLVYDTAKRGWAFPAAGRYRVVAEFKDADHGTVRSNVVPIEVSVPQGDDAAVLRSLRGLGLFLGVALPGPFFPQVVPLVEKYPTSVYFQRMRLNDLIYRIGDKPSQDRLPQLIDQASEIAEIEGAFTSLALLTLGQLQVRAGDLVQAKETLDKLVRELPGAAEVESARALLSTVERRRAPRVE